MKIVLDLDKSLEENAERCFSEAKKARQKIVGAKETIKRFEAKAEQAKQKAEQAEEKLQLKDNPKQWYHKYHWSFTSNGHLLIAGQNAAANESLMKNSTQNNDIIFHTDMAGSPFTILRPRGEISGQDKQDGAQLTGAYSRAWKGGLASIEAFYVKPEQVTKEAQSGEYLAKGSFMIRGDTNYLTAPVSLCIGVIEKEGFMPEVMAGSESACKNNCSKYASLAPGTEKTSDVAKKLQKRFGGILDEYVKAIPAGGCRIISLSDQ